jgi:5-methyltetrahydrofolate--homocysteine methyltransferase
MRAYLEEVDFETIKQRFDAFWEREIVDRPLILVTAPRAEQKKDDYPVPEKIEERWTNTDYVLHRMELCLENTCFFGDAIPSYMPGLGPNSFTAFLGANLRFRSEETSWAEPFVEDLLGYEPALKEDNKWWQAMNQLLDTVCEQAEGRFLVSVPDLHYGGDSLAAAVGTQKLARYLYARPEEVKRLVKRLTDICRHVFDRYYRKISRIQKGSTTWLPAYSRGRYFALQDDFSGLVSPKMFKEFFLEEQEMLSRYLDNAIYHLDGPMALGNLDCLLEIDALNGVQWCPGAGAKPMREWIDVCRKVLDADKCLVIGCEPGEVGFLLSRLEHGGLLLCTDCRTEKEARSVLRIVERHHK